MFEFLIQSFLTLFVVMDPIALVPAFLGMAGTRPRDEQLRLARKAVIVAGSVMLFFALLGKELLRYLGINLDAFRVSGGVLLFLMALDMVFARASGARETSEEESEAKSRVHLRLAGQWRGEFRTRHFASPAGPAHAGSLRTGACPR